MSSAAVRRGRRALVPWVLAALGAGLTQGFLWRHNLNLRDEGYLWYGVEALLRGEIPIRDFQAYDPGRYLLARLVSPLFGGGLLGVRGCAALVEAFGLAAGLFLLRRLVVSDAWLLPGCLLLVCWMFPRHKLFEPAMTLLALLAAVRLLERPSLGRHVVAGLTVGAGALLGRNHGLYLAFGFGLLALLATRRAPRSGVERTPPAQPGSRLLALAAGCLLGYAPMLVLLATEPGFANAFVERTAELLQNGSNLPKPFPWPWQPLASASSVGLTAARFCERVSFALPLLVLPLALLLALRPARRGDPTGARAVGIAAGVLGALYAHHYAVCSDLPHLAQAYPPVLFATLALARASLPWRHGAQFTLCALLVPAIGTALVGNAEWKDYAPWQERAPWKPVDVAGQRFDLQPKQAAIIRRVRAAIERHVAEAEPLFIAPTMPMWYPILAKRSPTWRIYFLWPSPPEAQRKLLGDLDAAGVRFALLIDRPLTGAAEYGFEHTHPLVHGAIVNGWVEVTDPQIPRAYHLYRRPNPPEPKPPEERAHSTPGR